MSKLNEAAEYLDAFGSAETLEERRAALAELIKKRVLTQAKDDPRLKSGIERLAELAENSQDVEEQLVAIALLSRISSVKSLEKVIKTVMSSVLASPLPEIAILSDPDDRYYVAGTLHYADYDWIMQYAAVSTVSEKQGKKARDEFVSILFDRADSLEQVFRVLTPVLEAFEPETKNVGDSIARRLEKIISAIRPKSVSVLIEPGKDAGLSIREMLRAAFIGAHPPESQDVAENTVEQVAGLLHDIARTQISLVTEPSLYCAVDVIKSWFTAPEWTYIAGKSPNLQLLARDIREALTLIAKQGITDTELFDQLVKVSGSRPAATKITREIVKAHAELDKEISEWLRTGGKVKGDNVLSGMEESQEISADAFIANLVVDSNQMKNVLTGMTEDVMTELRLIEPDVANIVSSLVSRCHAINNDVDALTAKRGISVKGNVGEVVEYSQSLHEMEGGHVQGVRKVKIVVPMVIREDAKGAVVVLRKAIVEKV